MFLFLYDGGEFRVLPVRIPQDQDMESVYGEVYISVHTEPARGRLN